MLCIFCLVGILLLRKNPWDNKIFYLWYVKCVFVWNEEHMLSTKLLLMGGSSWRVRLSGMEELGSGRRLQWGGPSPQWWESCVGDVADPLGSCLCLQLCRALLLSLHIPGRPKGSLCREVAQLRSVKQPDTSAAWVASGHWIFVLSLPSPAAGFLYRNMYSVT